MGVVGGGGGHLGVGFEGVGSHPGWYLDKALAGRGASIRRSVYSIQSECISGSAGKRGA